MPGLLHDLEVAEKLLTTCEPTGDPEKDYAQLEVLLTYERLVDSSRLTLFQQYSNDSPEATDYIFREYMLRHRISEFAMKLDKLVTDRITGGVLRENSVLAAHIKNREVYPKPVQR